ncbi:MAG TPA: hypothetical protein DIW80_20300 [Gordonia polyisoprenivorans]|nr:hypothetical protein [Gordonia polyisoprenivorans]
MMIPSRTVFDTWRTESVGAAGHTLGDSGEALDDEVSGARHAISRVAQDGLWSGVAAQSGETATDVGCRRATALSAVARNSAIGVARSAPDLTAAASRIRNLLTVIESGDLFVTDDWLVLPRVKNYPATLAATLATVADTFQVQLNPALVDLSRADHDIGAFVRRKLMGDGLGLALPEIDADPHAPKDFTEAPHGDNTGGTNPEFGRGLQRARLLEHMTGTVVETETTTAGDTTTTTVRMLDGSRQTYTSGPGVNRTEFRSPEGVLTATRTVAGDGTATVSLTRPGKSPAVVTERPDGTTEAVVDGITFPIPSSRDYAIALAAGGMSATESAVARGLPYLTQAQVARLEIGAKAAGPGLTLLGTAMGVATAENGYERCVAGVAGGVGLGADLALLALAPEMSPLRAFWTGAIVSLGGSTVGNIVGQVLCR